MARLIKPDGTEETVVPANGKKFTLEELQKHVGGYIQLLPGCGNTKILFDEEGLFKRLPRNLVATQFCINGGFPCYSVLVGNVLILDKKEKM